MPKCCLSHLCSHAANSIQLLLFTLIQMIRSVSRVREKKFQIGTLCCSVNAAHLQFVKPVRIPCTKAHKQLAVTWGVFLRHDGGFFKDNCKATQIEKGSTDRVIAQCLECIARRSIKQPGSFVLMGFLSFESLTCVQDCTAADFNIPREGLRLAEATGLSPCLKAFWCSGVKLCCETASLRFCRHEKSPLPPDMLMHIRLLFVSYSAHNIPTVSSMINPLFSLGIIFGLNLNSP